MGSNTANTKMLWDELKERIQIKHKKEIPISLEELCSVDVISSHWTEILPSYVIPGSAKTRWSGWLGTISVEVNVRPACLSACDRLSICAGCFLAFTPRCIARQLPTLYKFAWMYQRQNGELPFTLPHFLHQIVHLEYKSIISVTPCLFS